MRKSIPRPVAYVLTATNHGTMIVNRHDYRLVGDGGYGVGHQLLQTSSFDQPEIDLALQLLESRRMNFGVGVVAVDCGANIGAHTVEWARFMHGWGGVLAFEAQEKIFYALAGNLAINNCFNARAVWAAVGSSSGSIGVPVPDYFTPSSFGSLELRKTQRTEFIGQSIDYSPEKLLPTEMLAIDDLQLARLDFLKIDIEGMEMDALAGSRQSITKHKPQILIEKIKSDEAGLRAYLIEHGYQIHTMGINLLAIHADDPVRNQLKIVPA
jgi:FkbM family methyltransferase